MKKLFITKIILEKIRNLEHIEIPLSNDGPKHFIITGKNGSGKTTILDGLSKYLNTIATSNDPMEAEKSLLMDRNSLAAAKARNASRSEISEIEKRIKHYKQRIEDAKQGFEVEMNFPLEEFRPEFEAGKFVIAYYKAERVFEADIPKHVEKVELKKSYTIQEDPRKNFVKYLLDLKMTQALADSGNKKEKAQKIKNWFNEFEHLLQRIFENDQLKLEFDEDTFKFNINEPGKELYDFNTLSSGYAAILDIVVDIMIRMERQTEKRFQYDLPGIVLIDEIETHLHLELQKKILDLLTTMFSNIQFIVSTHSPFILNSIENVVIYDLEQQILVKNGLADIPYDGIVEGYFSASVLSDSLINKFERYKKIIKKKNLSDDEFEEVANLEMYLDEIPDYLALGITTEYQKLKLEFSKREDIDG